MGFFLLTMGFSFAQNNSIYGVNLLDYYLINNQISKAKLELKTQINRLESQKLFDSLYQYPYYIGKISQNQNSTKKAISEAEHFANSVLEKTQNFRTHYKTLLNLVNFYDEVGENHKSIEVTKEALKNVQKINNASLDEIGKVQYNLGASYLAINNIDDAIVYFRKAIINYETEPNTSKKKLSDGYNAMGAMMWMSTKLDSAKIYYQKAIESISKNKGDKIENLYLATVIQSNISLLEYTQGNLSNALEIQKEVINNYEIVIVNSKDEVTKNKALRYQARALSNLAVFYNDLGNLKKSYEILKYSYKKKVSFLEPNDRELATTLINIGQAELILQEFNDAITTLDEALLRLNKSEGEKNYWSATAFFAKAEAYSKLNNISEAKKLYKESELLFEKALGDNYDKEFLNFLQSKALFLSENNNSKTAIETALKGYNYVNKNTTTKTDFPLINHIATVSKVYYNNKNYLKAKEWAKKGIDYLDSNISENKTKIDSIRLEFERPHFLLLEIKSNTKIVQKKDSVFYKNQILKLEKAIDILEIRKTTTLNIEDVNHLFSQYKEVYDFTKNLYLKLYQQTQNEAYLDKVIGLHESAIYNRIRTRLNIRNNISFNNIPPEILKTEKELKQKMNNSLSNSDDSVSAIQNFFEANKQWNQFLTTLKNNYPKYYKMRYATIEEPLGDIQKSIKKNTTVVRYLFIENNLYAFVIDKNKKLLLPLPYQSKNGLVNKLGENQYEIEQTSTLFFQLYQQLWKPLEEYIHTKKIIIIPDGELFNLSFETLTKSRIKSFKELSNNSLLANYYISYNYSLFLLKQENNTLNYQNNFIAFAPEFNDKMKDDYLVSIKDSIYLDKTYLRLLPQPFSVDLVKKYTNEFKGTMFINEKSTKQIFKEKAKEHKIIHIGTHAESNNLSPELSRLIFAKDVSENTSEKENSLFTYEIYDYNLSSNLTILTACETGKPTYQSGEGMISLAHAFNYAGSESILTSLWRIDEQSSNKIIQYFYDNLTLEMSKDEALQKAKLEYLKNANGRTIEPQYWSGIILIGNSNPIGLTSNFNSYFVWAFIIGLFLFYIYYIKLNKNNQP